MLSLLNCRPYFVGLCHRRPSLPSPPGRPGSRHTDLPAGDVAAGICAPPAPGHLPLPARPQRETRYLPYNLSPSRILLPASLCPEGPGKGRSGKFPPSQVPLRQRRCGGGSRSWDTSGCGFPLPGAGPTFLEHSRTAMNS